MRLIYNYQTDDFAVSHSGRTGVLTASLDGAEEMVHTFDISHWSSDDFMEFAGLSTHDRVEQIERLTEVKDNSWDTDNGCTHDWNFIDNNEETMQCVHCGNFQN